MHRLTVSYATELATYAQANGFLCYRTGNLGYYNKQKNICQEKIKMALGGQPSAFSKRQDFGDCWTLGVQAELVAQFHDASIDAGLINPVAIYKCLV